MNQTNTVYAGGMLHLGTNCLEDNANVEAIVAAYNKASEELENHLAKLNAVRAAFEFGKNNWRVGTPVGAYSLERHTAIVSEMYTFFNARKDLADCFSEMEQHFFDKVDGFYIVPDDRTSLEEDEVRTIQKDVESYMSNHNLKKVAIDIVFTGSYTVIRYTLEESGEWSRTKIDDPACFALPHAPLWMTDKEYKSLFCHHLASIGITDESGEEE